MAKSFDDYRAEHSKEPFPLPMPDGKPVLLPRTTINEQVAVTRAVAEAREAGEWTPFTGLEHLVSAEDAERIKDAWGGLGPDAWDAVMADMREHFGLGKQGS